MADPTPEQIHDAFLDAERLRAEPTFQAAVVMVRKQALETLVTTDPTDIDKMRDAQAMVRAIDQLATHIGHAILRWKALPRSQQKQVLGD